MQVLHSEKNTITKDNFIEGFLIGTKKNANGWQVSKTTLPKLIDGFIGTPFTIIPEKLAHGIDAHFHGATKQETINGYNAYSHGTIEKILGPFPYDDGTDDFYYKHITKLSNSKSASLLAEYGAKTKTPFAVSPHIWHEDAEITDYVQNFTPIGISLVSDGAYGSIAIINRLCQGTADTCHRSLGASHCGCCENTDDNVAKIVSSHFSKYASNSQIMSLNTDVSSPSNTQQSTVNSNNNANPTLNPQTHLTQEPQSPDKIVLTKEQYDLIQQREKDFESTRKRLENLENEHKTNILGNIFSSDIVTDETTRNNLIEKWKTVDVKLVKDLHQDILASIVPSLIEKAKAEALKTAAEEQAKTTTTEKEKSKSAALLKPEPKVPTSNNNEDKSASAEPQRVNEVALLRKYAFGGL